MSDIQEGSSREPGTRSELIKFGILVIVLLGVVLGVALLRPVIFNQIVPAVMGWDQPKAPVSVDDSDKPAVDTAPAEPAAEPEADEAAEPAPEDAAEPAAASDDEEDGTTVLLPAVPTDGTDDTVTGEETAVTHTVQRGENLTTIADRYGVTVNDLIAANDISNPNRITAGTVLQIPQE